MDHFFQEINGLTAIEIAYKTDVEKLLLINKKDILKKCKNSDIEETV